MDLLKQSTAVTLLIGPFVDSTDGVTAEDALTISQADVRLSSNGGNMAQKHESTACTHDELGYYTCPLDTTDTGTLGVLKVMVSEAGALPVWQEYMVVPAAVYDSIVAGSDKLPVDAQEWQSVAITSGSVPAAAAGGAGGLALVGSKTDLVDAPNGTAITAIQNGLSTYAGGDTAGTTTLLSRLTATRAAYIDALNVTGLVASAADIAAITQAARVRIVVPAMMERPDSESLAYRVWVYAYNEQHQAEDLDSSPTVTAENNVGTDRSANLSAVTKPGGTTGTYYVDYTVAVAHAVEGLVLKVTATEGTVATTYAQATIVVDTTAVDFTATDRATLATISGYVDDLETRLTAQRAANLDELGAANLPADVDTLKGYCDILDDATNGLAAIKTMLTTAAGDVAGLDGSTMLTAAAVKSAIEAAGSHLALIKAVTDTLSGAATGGVFSAEALANAPGGDLTAEGIDTQLSGTHGAGTWGGAAGSGSRTVTVTVQTSGGTVYANVPVTCNNQSETGTSYTLNTNSLGQATFYLTDGDWRAIAAGSNLQSGGATNFAVNGPETPTVTVTAVTVPATTSADNYLLYGYERKLEADAAFGASGVTVKVLSVDSAGQYDAAADACRRIMGTSYATDATGLWSFEVAKALADRRLKLRFTWTDAASITQTEEWQATILASAANPQDQIAWADLSPTKTR